MIYCDACYEIATRKDYRGDNKYFVCFKHFIMDNRNFFKAIKRKGEKENGKTT